MKLSSEEILYRGLFLDADRFTLAPQLAGVANGEATSDDMDTVESDQVEGGGLVGGRPGVTNVEDFVECKESGRLGVGEEC